MTHNNIWIKYIKKFAPILGIALFIYIIYSIGTDKIAVTFLKISPIFLIIAFLLYIPRVLIKNYQWQFILKAQKINISYFESLKILLIGAFYSQITPAGLGHLIKIPYLKDKTNEPTGKLVVNSSILSAVNTIPFYIPVLIVMFLFIDIPMDIKLFSLFVFLVVISPYMFFIKKERGQKTLNFIINKFIPKRVKLSANNFAKTIYKDFPRMRDLIIPTLLSFPTWIITSAVMYMIALSIGFNVPFIAYLFLTPIASLVGCLPISIGGLGTKEAALIYFFSSFSVSPEKIVVISIISHLIYKIPNLISGFAICLWEAKNIRINSSLKKKKPSYVLD